MSRTDRLMRLMDALRRLPRPVTAARLAAETGVSARQLYRDIATLRAGGALIDGEAGVGYALTEDPALPPQSFSRLIAALPEVISAWTLTGEADYLLRIYCADLPALNRLIHQQLLPHPAVARVQSQIVMDQLKLDAALPT